jgi:UTP--glucose-1-phosphate uridylyltransferase
MLGTIIPRKAVLPVGGWGTRFLPASKSVPKAMFPIINKPIIQFAVDEAITAGIEQIQFIISPHARAIEEYFSPSPDLESFLEKKQKLKALQELREIVNSVYFSFIPSQPRGNFIGLGVAVLNAKNFVNDDPFAVILPNDLLETSIPCMEALMRVFEATQCPVLAVQRVPLERLATYGNVAIQPLDETTNSLLSDRLHGQGKVWEVTKLIQKPDPQKQEHLSDYAIIGRFILLPKIFTILEEIPPGYEGEVQLIDAIEELRCRGQRILAYEFDGQYFDTRSESGYVKAILNEALKMAEFKEEIRVMIKSRTD